MARQLFLYLGDTSKHLRFTIQSMKAARQVQLQQEMIKIIELDIRIENICLKDRFEWDINDPHNNPEVKTLELR